MRRPPGLIYALDDVPPLGKLTLMGLQQAVLQSIFLIVPILVTHSAGLSFADRQNTISLSLVVLALGSAMQANRRTGSGMLTPPVLTATYLTASLQAAKLAGMALVAGMTMVAGAAEIALAALLKPLRSFLPTYLCGLITVAVGFDVGLVGVDELLGMQGRHTPLDIAAGMVTLSTMIGFSVWGRNMVRLLAPMLGILAGASLTVVTGQLDPQRVADMQQASWVGLPHLPAFGYALREECFIPFLVGALACALRTVGVLATAQKINDADYQRPETTGITRGVVADGATTLIAGALASPGVAASPSSVAISETTGATSRVIAYAAGAWLLLLALLPRLAASFLVVPDPVLGGSFVYMGATLFSSGLKMVTARPLDIRHTMVIGVAVMLGLARKVTPSFFEALPSPWNLFSGSLLTLTTLSGLALFAILRIGSKQTATMVQMDLPEQAKKWPVPEAIRKDTQEMVGRLVRVVQDHHLVSGEVQVDVSYDETSYAVELTYTGTPLVLAQHGVSEPSDQGLFEFLEQIQPDELQSFEKRGQSRVKVVFAL